GRRAPPRASQLPKISSIGARRHEGGVRSKHARGESRHLLRIRLFVKSLEQLTQAWRYILCSQHDLLGDDVVILATDPFVLTEQLFRVHGPDSLDRPQ